MKTTKLTGLAFVFFLACLRCSAVEVLLGPFSHNGHDYYLLEQSTWTEANAKAVQMGGYLTSISDASENTWVWNTFSNDGARSLWIGFTDEASEGNFVWTSGEDVTYTNWEPAQPTNSGGVEHYTLMRFGVLHDPTVGPASWNDMPGDVNFWDRRSIHGVVEIPVPSGGSSAIMLFGSLLGLAGVRRYLRAA